MSNAVYETDPAGYVYRIGSEETRKTKGTGLGLFIVQQVVKAHNGRIQVLDNQPKGTVFRIVIGN